MVRGAYLDVLQALRAYWRAFSGSAGNPTASVLGSYTVRIRNDTAECRSGDFTKDTNGIVVVRSTAVASDGRTAVVLEATFGPQLMFSRNRAQLPTPVLCNSGKDACDDNSGIQYGVVAN